MERDREGEGKGRGGIGKKGKGKGKGKGKRVEGGKGFCHFARSLLQHQHNIVDDDREEAAAS